MGGILLELICEQFNVHAFQSHDFQGTEHTYNGQNGVELAKLGWDPAAGCPLQLETI